MSLARPIYARTTYMITRRCVERLYLLYPSELVNQIVAYALAVGQKRYKVLVHVFCVMSNHWHLIVTDILGNLPNFLRDVHAMIAKCINAATGREGALWAPGKAHWLELADPTSFLSASSYVVTNPVAAGLVRSPEEWPGLITTRFDQTWTVERPKDCFGKETELAEEATLRLSLPPMLGDRSIEQVQKDLDNAVAQIAENKRNDMAKRGKKFVGRSKILKGPVKEKAETTEKPRARISRIAASNEDEKAAWMQRRKLWLIAYREALTKWLEGKREVHFPSGTWHMHHVHRAIRAEA